MDPSKILLVDDSPTVRMMLEDKLTELGHEVRAAENGKVAVEILIDFLPELVITDVSMPEMDGFELCRHLKNDERLREIPVIMLTAATEEKDVCEGLGLGASDYIRKPFSAAELALRVQNILTSERQRCRLREVFARHSSPEVVAELLKRSDDLMLSGEIREVAALFADIRGFTRIVSMLPPEQIISDLNQYLTVMSEAVIGEGGTLDKFLGDGIMAIFGAPLQHNDDALRAVRAAIRVQERVRDINAARGREGRDPMWVGIGITFGLAVVGNIGSSMRMDYTAIGDCVNMASRLQGLAQGGQIIVTGEVKNQLNGRVDLSPMAPVTVKGKSELIKVFSVPY